MDWSLIFWMLFFVKKYLIAYVYMNCDELKKRMLECSKEEAENRECKEIMEKFQFECEKKEKSSWFNWSNEEKKEDKEEMKEEMKEEDKE